MPAPVWIVAIRDPAYAYMLRSSGVRRPRAHFRRRNADNFSGGYAPLGAHLPPTTPEALQELRAQARTRSTAFTASVREVEDRHGDVLQEAVAELMRVGSATLHASAGDVEARILRFRKDAVVLEIHFPGGRTQSRTTVSSVAGRAFHQLANALASARPDMDPLI